MRHPLPLDPDILGDYDDWHRQIRDYGYAVLPDRVVDICDLPSERAAMVVEIRWRPSPKGHVASRLWDATPGQSVAYRTPPKETPS